MLFGIVFLLVSIDTCLAALTRVRHGSESRQYFTYELHSCWVNSFVFLGMLGVGLVHGWAAASAAVYALFQIAGALYAGHRLDTGAVS